MKFSVMAKPAVASLIILLLMFAGFRGRQYARLQARLADVTTVRDQLQRKMDGAPKTAEKAVPLTALIAALRTRLGQFEAVYVPNKLPRPEHLELRLSRATLANAEQRYNDALADVTAEDEQTRADTVRVLRVRADAFYGLRQWNEALDRYQRFQGLRPDRPVVLARIAACHFALGNAAEAAKHQEKAVELAPDQDKPQLRAQLEIYKSGKRD